MNSLLENFAGNGVEKSGLQSSCQFFTVAVHQRRNLAIEEKETTFH